MRISPITHILEIARMVRDATKQVNPTTAIGAIQIIKGLDPNSPEMIRCLEEIQRQIIHASYVIENDVRMDVEGRDGLLQQLVQLKLMFGVHGLNTSHQSYVPNPDVLVSQFAIIAGFYGTTAAPYENTKPGLAEIAAEIDLLAGSIANSGQDKEIKKLLDDQLRALKFFVLNVEMLGFDAAYSAYFDLVIRLRRAEKRSESAAAYVSEIWPSVERWAGRLAIIEGIASNSEKLIETASHIQKLIT